ncbi:MAG: fatty acid hydroxylase [Halobacteriovoraceae bacterium]|nr:fatty acid hydroxylase [Halobacteriovoraceae bacterium]
MKGHSSVRVFENPLLEWCTHVHPLVPLLLWSPIVFLCLRSGVVDSQLSASEWSWLFVAAFFSWTFTEYFLHRVVFHFPAKSRAGKYFVYLFHGLHHDDPDDASRLVMPPVPAILIMGLLTLFFGLFFSPRYLSSFMGFFIIGYLFYDYIHYGTHHFKMKNPLARYLKKFHLQHHHSKEAAKYGVSSPIWDIILGTMTGPKKDRK